MRLIDLETNLLFYKIINNTISTKDYLKWSYILVDANIESESLYKILSMKESESVFVFDEYVNRALFELGIAVPVFEKCARANIYSLCKELINNERNGFDIVKDIFNVAVELGYPHDLSVWLNFDDDIDRIIYDDEYYKLNEIELRLQILKEAKKVVDSQQSEDFS